MSFLLIAPKIESHSACKITSPSECPDSFLSDLTLTPPNMIPFPGTSLCTSNPFPTLKEML